MSPPQIGIQYDRIAAWWNERHLESQYGVAQFERALAFRPGGGRALDVGCGSGGRFVRRLLAREYDVTGIDASSEMIALAKANHPDCRFHQTDIVSWNTDQRFDFILAWDCLFHLALGDQAGVLSKLCGMLEEGGVILHSFGDGIGEHCDEWHGQSFRYSSIGINANLKILIEAGLTVRHMELDQFPQPHVLAIAQKDNR